MVSFGSIILIVLSAEHFLTVKAAVWKKRSAFVRTGWSVRIAATAIDGSNE